jgi:hypothetical protein
VINHSLSHSLGWTLHVSMSKYIIFTGMSRHMVDTTNILIHEWMNTLTNHVLNQPINDLLLEHFPHL